MGGFVEEAVVMAATVALPPGLYRMGGWQNGARPTPAADGYSVVLAVIYVLLC
jgi:hypothetical protein